MCIRDSGEGARVVGVAVLALEPHEAADRQPVERVDGLAAVTHDLCSRREADPEFVDADAEEARQHEVAELVDDDERAEDEDEEEDRDRPLDDRHVSSYAGRSPAVPGALNVARTSRSSATRSSYPGACPAPIPMRATASSRRRGIPGKSSVPARNRATATSSAAISAAVARDPSSPASRAIRSAGKRDSSGARNSSRPAATRSGATAGDGRRNGYVIAYWVGSRMSGVPSWALSEPSTKRTAEWTTDWGWMTTSIAGYATP